MGMLNAGEKQGVKVQEACHGDAPSDRRHVDCILMRCAHVGLACDDDRIAGGAARND
jgi:hypothetical protein